MFIKNNLTICFISIKIITFRGRLLFWKVTLSYLRVLHSGWQKKKGETFVWMRREAGGGSSQASSVEPNIFFDLICFYMFLNYLVFPHFQIRFLVSFLFVWVLLGFFLGKSCMCLVLWLLVQVSTALSEPMAVDMTMSPSSMWRPALTERRRDGRGEEEAQIDLLWPSEDRADKSHVWKDCFSVLLMRRWAAAALSIDSSINPFIHSHLPGEPLKCERFGRRKTTTGDPSWIN